MIPPNLTNLGRYEIIDEIGRGAMGAVYLARDPLIGRLVALKTFRLGYAMDDRELEQFRVRFFREAQSAGILSHPNIVTIHDVVDESGMGLAFIAMEYVQGTNLKALLKKHQPMSLPLVVELIAQVADALDYAHSHRVIHRDVKPANILITPDDRVKLTDFGIALLDTSNLTQEGQLIGTPHYMSPEQVQGKQVDHRSDLFALGVVLYEMLTRHKPFTGESLTIVSHRIVYDYFTPPEEYVSEMPPGVEPILSRALDKDPSRRYQRAKEMVADLRRAVGVLSSNSDPKEALSLSIQAATPPQPPITDGTLGSGFTTLPVAQFDVFICHASEDKPDFVDSLAQRLREKNLSVWYDAFMIRVGDSLRTAIDEGLYRSRFGIVVLSPSFCRKDWPKRELEGLLALEKGNRKVILPIWHLVTREDVARFSPILADRIALTSALPLERIVDEILSVVRK